MRKSYTVGALLRKNFRRSLIRSGVQYTEDRGLLDSLFTVHATQAVHNLIIDYINKVNHQQEYDFFNHKLKKGKLAEDFIVYASRLIDQDGMIETKNGWFKTKVSIFCHPSTAKRLDDWINLSTRIEKLSINGSITGV